MTTVYPLNFHIGPLTVTGYGIMMMAGFLVGGWLIDRSLRARGWNHDYAADITVAAVIGGVVGAKLWYVAATGDMSSIFSRGGLVWYGGFIGGALAVLANGRRLNVPMRWTLELTAPALAAAYALGRVGCFVVNDDYGLPSTLPWSVKFPQGLPPTTAGSMAHDFGIPLQAGLSPDTLLAVQPTQLYEVVLMTAAFMLLWRLRGHAKSTGWLFGLYAVLAGTERFLVEFVRAKEDRLPGGFTLAQLTAVGLVLLGGVLLAKWGGGERLPPGAYLGGNAGSGAGNRGAHP
jgi:phosphatidylglycerol:prolipoprotein diacylglycerol transferase